MKGFAGKKTILKKGLFEKSRGFEVGLKFVGTKIVELSTDFLSLSNVDVQLL